MNKAKALILGIVVFMFLLTSLVGVYAETEKELQVGVVRDPINRRYATTGVEPYITGIYEPLVFVSPDMELQPGLAKSWERIDDLTWRFHLREGVEYHNGKAFNAETAKFSLDHINENILWAARLRLDRIEVVDEYTIDVITTEPLNVVPGFLSHGWTVMSEPESMEAEEVVGTGPFQYDSSVAGERLTLVKNENYWQEGQPKVDKIEFNVMPDDSSRIMALMGNQIDLALQIPYPRVDDLKAQGFNTFETLTSTWSYLHFCQHEEPLDDLRVRKAVAHAINREEIAEHVLYGLATASNSPILPTAEWSGEDSLQGHSFDPYRAKELLEEAGWVENRRGIREKEGETLSLTLRLYDDPSVIIQGRETTQVMTEQLGRVGFDVNISVEEMSMFYDESAANRKGHLYLDYGGTYSGELSATLYDAYEPNRKEYTEGTAVYGDFIPPIVGEWLAALQTADTDEERERYLLKISRLVNRDMVLTLPFLNYQEVVGAVPEVTGYTAHPLFFWPTVWNEVDIEQ